MRYKVFEVQREEPNTHRRTGALIRITSANNEDVKPGQLIHPGQIVGLGAYNSEDRFRVLRMISVETEKWPG